MQNGDEASTSISPAGSGQLVKMLITLVNHMVNFVPILLTYTFQHYVATGMRNGDKALQKNSTATVDSGTALTKLLIQIVQEYTRQYTQPCLYSMF